MTTHSYLDAARAIVATGRWLDAKGWAPATSGNYSCRVDDGSFAVTVSGRHKGRLTSEDVMRVDADGGSLDGKRPSAETALHLAIYAAYPAAGAVLHSHSPTAVGFTRAFPALSTWTIAGHEMLKALPGITTHDTAILLPIVDNSQDMAVIWNAVSPLLDSVPAYLIRGHGLYSWGADMAEAERVIEAVEWLIMAELAEAQFRNKL
jgi:methylthioribulose-1-phosphate dehydratase